MTLNIDHTNGTQETITVDVRGNTVQTQITTDAATADRIRLRSADLQDSLGQHGLESKRLRVGASAPQDTVEIGRTLAGEREGLRWAPRRRRPARTAPPATGSATAPRPASGIRRSRAGSRLPARATNVSSSRTGRSGRTASAGQPPSSGSSDDHVRSQRVRQRPVRHDPGDAGRTGRRAPRRQPPSRRLRVRCPPTRRPWAATSSSRCSSPSSRIRTRSIRWTARTWRRSSPSSPPSSSSSR
jgi:hypothetical protein